MPGSPVNRKTKSICPVCGSPGEFEQSLHVLGGSDPKSYDYHRCHECGLLYQQPMPSAGEIAGFYPDTYAVYSEPTRTEFSERERRTLRKMGYQLPAGKDSTKLSTRLRGAKPVPSVIPFVAGGRVLDIGCANGEYLLRLKSIGWHCQGVEFNPKAVAVARSHGLDVFSGGLLEAGFEADSFDFVTSNHHLEHEPDPCKIMAEIVRVTRPGGVVLIRTPNNAALGRRWFGEYWYPNGVPGHLLMFSDKSLHTLAAKYGLVLRQRYQPVEYKFVLKSIDLRSNSYYDGKSYGKLKKWLAKLYIPAARMAGQGDELFYVYTKPAS